LFSSFFSRWFFRVVDSLRFDGTFFPVFLSYPEARRYVMRATAGVAFFILLFYVPAHSAPDDDVYAITTHSLVPGVYPVQRQDPLRDPVEPNALFIVNDDDVVVFEGGGAPIVAERTIALVLNVSDKPVSHAINSHWHGALQQDDTYIRRLEALLAEVRRQVGEPIKRGASDETG
jgi:hypothetical protein